jgi:hypothetical protein
MSFDQEFVKYNLTQRFVCKRNSLTYPGRNGFNREIRDTLLNWDKKSFIEHKCCFLLALASGRRRSEVHAFSTSNSCLRFSRDKSSVTLLTDPAFLGKNQLPDKGAEPIYIQEK